MAAETRRCRCGTAGDMALAIGLLSMHSMRASTLHHDGDATDDDEATRLTEAEAVARAQRRFKARLFDLKQVQCFLCRRCGGCSSSDAIRP